jgi:hypothetical protein
MRDRRGLERHGGIVTRFRLSVRAQETWGRVAGENRRTTSSSWPSQVRVKTRHPGCGTSTPVGYISPGEESAGNCRVTSGWSAPAGWPVMRSGLPLRGCRTYQRILSPAGTRRRDQGRVEDVACHSPGTPPGRLHRKAGPAAVRPRRRGTATGRAAAGEGGTGRCAARGRAVRGPGSATAAQEQDGGRQVRARLIRVLRGPHRVTAGPLGGDRPRRAVLSEY